MKIPWSLLIWAGLLMGGGGLIVWFMARQYIRSLTIRRGGQACSGQVVEAKRKDTYWFGSSFYPVFQITPTQEEQAEQLESVRPMVTILRYKQVLGAKRVVYRNPQHPQHCTFGPHWAELALTLLAVAVGLFFIWLGVFFLL